MHRTFFQILIPEEEDNSDSKREALPFNSVSVIYVRILTVSFHGILTTYAKYERGIRNTNEEYEQTNINRIIIDK